MQGSGALVTGLCGRSPDKPQWEQEGKEMKKDQQTCCKARGNQVKQMSREGEGKRGGARERKSCRNAGSREGEMKDSATNLPVFSGENSGGQCGETINGPTTFN